MVQKFPSQFQLSVGVMLTIEDPNTPNEMNDSLREMHHSSNGTWQADTARDLVVFLQPNLTLISYQATIDTILYADKTAETTNQDALNRALAARKSEAQNLEAENVAIQHALANPGDASPEETAATEIEASEKSREAAYDIQTNGQPSGGVLELQNARRAAAYFRQTIPDYLNGLVSRNASEHRFCGSMPRQRS